MRVGLKVRFSIVGEPIAGVDGYGETAASAIGSRASEKEDVDELAE